MKHEEHNENLRTLANIYSKKVDGTMQGGFYGSTAEALETSATIIAELEAKLATVRVRLEKIAAADTQSWALLALTDLKGDEHE
jgi:hypothetical protein